MAGESDAFVTAFAVAAGPRGVNAISPAAAAQGPSSLAAADRSNREVGHAVVADPVVRQVQPGLEFFPAPGVHADLAAAPALTASDQERAASLIEVGFCEAAARLRVVRCLARLPLTSNSIASVTSERASATAHFVEGSKSPHVPLPLRRLLCWSEEIADLPRTGAARQPLVISTVTVS
jgi:hypothetical protein